MGILFPQIHRSIAWRGVQTHQFPHRDTHFEWGVDIHKEQLVPGRAQRTDGLPEFAAITEKLFVQIGGHAMTAVLTGKPVPIQTAPVQVAEHQNKMPRLSRGGQQ